MFSNDFIKDKGRDKEKEHIEKAKKNKGDLDAFEIKDDELLNNFN